MRFCYLIRRVRARIKPYYAVKLKNGENLRTFTLKFAPLGKTAVHLKKSVFMTCLLFLRNYFHKTQRLLFSRAYFDQDRGAEFLRRVSVDSIDSEILARYTVLGATFALLKYVETTSSLTFPQASVKLRFIDNNAGEFMTIDRRTALGLEILANARSGDQKNCLFGTINRTKVSIISCDSFLSFHSFIAIYESVEI